MKKVFLLALMILFSMVSISYAQIEAGTKEFGVAISYTIPEEGDNTYTAMANFGYFITPKLQLGISGFTLGGTDYSSDGVFGTVKYHFYSKGQTVVPYIGAQAGMFAISNGVSYTSFSYGGMGGLKFFVREDTSINLEANYLRYSSEVQVGRATIEQDTSQLQLLVGLSFYFGK